MKKSILAISVLALGAGVLFATIPSADAFRGDPNTTGPNYTHERHEAMEKSFENKDYNAWKKLVQGKGRVTQVVNEKNFSRFAEMHELREEGKIDEANKIRAELGLGLHKGKGAGQKMGMGQYQNK